MYYILLFFDFLSYWLDLFKIQIAHLCQCYYNVFIVFNNVYHCFELLYMYSHRV